MSDTPRSTVPPTPDLWLSIADAQDAALAKGRASSGVDPVPAVRGANGRRRRVGALALALGAAAAGIAIYAHNAPLRVQLGHGGLPGAPGEALVADARSDLPLLFSDGSAVTFRAGAAGRMQRLTAAGAELELAHGRLEAHVVHATSTLWLVHAGPYRVRVTGTRFTVDWVNPRLNVAVYEGSVVVDGGALGAGVPLRAGQHLTVRDGVVRTEALPPGELSKASQIGDGIGSTMGTAGAPEEVRLAVGEPTAPLMPGTLGATGATGLVGGDAERFSAPGAADPQIDDAEADVGVDDGDVDGKPGTAERGADTGHKSGAGKKRRTGARSGGHRTSGGRLVATAHDRDWLPPAERGEYPEALAIAKRVGWSGLCGRLDARRLLMLGDVARYAGAPKEARVAFKALVRRFPENRLAADAVFSLGRLTFEAGHQREAATWFRLYVRRWPSGPMADQAIGRLMECAVRMDNDVAARGAARDYLARAPQGPHAPLANKILGETPDRLNGGPSGDQ